MTQRPESSRPHSVPTTQKFLTLYYIQYFDIAPPLVLEPLIAANNSGNMSGFDSNVLTPNLRLSRPRKNYIRGSSKKK
jgi:hypothetical protein